MCRTTALFLVALFVCSCSDRRDNEHYNRFSTNELAKLIGMMTFVAEVSLTEGQSLHVGTFDESGQQRGFAVFQASERLVDARVVLSYWKPDKSPEARYGYILPSGMNGTGTFRVPQPYTGVTASTTVYKAGIGFAFLQFQGAETYFGYWITPNKPDARDD